MKEGRKENPFREIPKVGDLLEDERVKRLIERYGRKVVTYILKELVEEVRGLIVSKGISTTELSRIFGEKLEEEMNARLRVLKEGGLKKVVNATGIIIHTTLGRAPLSKAVADKIKEVATSYTNLEFDLKERRRWERHHHIEKLVKILGGGEASLVVNNNASAVFLILNTFSPGREVLISRGELIEIGGSFRLPVIMEKSGAIIREVGTTNRTRISDFEEAISERTAMILKVHRSNFRIKGYVDDPSWSEIVRLAKANRILSVFDIGSGCIAPLPKNLKGTEEPILSQCIEEGFDIVTFSCDKLLGGPQAGLITGRAPLIEKLYRNPISRILRVDKLILSGLYETLKFYLFDGGEESELPVMKMLGASMDTLKKRAESLLDRLKKEAPEVDRLFKFEVRMEKCFGGGGSLPDVEIDTFTLCLTPMQEGMTLEYLDRELARASTPVIGRKKGGRFILDMRCLLEGDEDLIVSAFKEIMKRRRHDEG